MNVPSNPDERFDQVDSTLNLLANSQRHLLTAQVLLNDRMERAETAIQKTAEQGLQTSRRLDSLTEKLGDLADKFDALTDIVRNWYERHGNGSSGQHPS